MCCDLVYYRVFHTEDKQSLHYKKVKGTSAIEGQIFEYKFCALTYIKAINEGLNFKLACNVEGFGIFDDVVLECLDASGRTSHICVQLKRKERQTVTVNQLLDNSGDFSLIKHYESYIAIEEMFKRRQQNDQTKGNIDDCLFIIYTNADVERRLKSDNSTESGHEKLLNTDGAVLKFSEEANKDIYQHFKDEPGYGKFFSRYRIMYKQADEKDMDQCIISLLQEQLKFPDSEKDSACQIFCKFIMGWWQEKVSSYFLQKTNIKGNDPLQKTSEELLKNSVSKKIVEVRSKFNNLRINYKQSAIKDMKLLTEPHKAVLIFAPGRSTTLTAAKIHQKLNNTSHILNLQQLVLDKSEVMLAWQTMFDVLVLENKGSTENFQELCNEIYKLINKCDDKKFIFISSETGNIQQTSAIRKIFSKNLTVIYDEWKFTELVTKSQMLFLEKEVYFQGAEIKLSKIVNGDEVGILNALSFDSASRLLENEKLSIGIAIEHTVQYYIDRTLQCNNDVKTGVPIQGEIKPALNKDILQEFQDIGSNQKKEVEIETSPHLTPSTLLDVKGQVILVTDEPGMGKSTLLTHLAKQTRESHSDMWIVRVNINNYTQILNDLN
jgi:KaiC/GvpD/RAD55 family RecA-like ATPase